VHVCSCHNDYFTVISLFLFDRIAYSVYEIERLLTHCDESADVKVTYDIGCTLSAHLKVGKKCPVYVIVYFRVEKMSYTK
jgi:hypothetical protein